MNDIKYGMIEEIYFLDDIRRKTYGIAAYANSEKDGTATVIAAINDICHDRSKLAEFVESCNRLELSLEHLYDAVDDFVADEN